MSYYQDAPIGTGRMARMDDHKNSLFDFSFGKAKKKGKRTSSKGTNSQSSWVEEEVPVLEELELSSKSKTRSKLKAREVRKDTSSSEEEEEEIEVDFNFKRRLKKTDLEQRKKGNREKAEVLKDKKLNKTFPKIISTTTTTASTENTPQKKRKGRPPKSNDLSSSSAPITIKNTRGRARKRSVDTATATTEDEPSQSPPKRMTRNNLRGPPTTPKCFVNVQRLTEEVVTSSSSVSKEISSPESETKASVTIANAEDDDTTEEVDEEQEDSKPVVQFFISEQMEQYKRLRNAVPDNKFECPLVYTENAGMSMTASFSQMEEQEPGIMRVRGEVVPDKFATGFMEIGARTLLPLELYKKLHLVYFVLKGEVTVKCAGAWVTRDTGNGDGNYLFGKVFGVGSCITLKRETIYSLENHGDQPALLGYVEMKEE